MTPTPLLALPQLEKPDQFEAPTLRIRAEEDVTLWKQTTGYKNYMLFLRRLSESVVNQYLPLEEPPSPAVMKTVILLDRLDAWIGEIPPLPTPQRFGNLAFRTWGQRLEDNADDLLKQLLPECSHNCVHLIKPYLVLSFGSFTRMDYGTGHEAAFAILLMCLSLIRFFLPEPAEEQQLVAVVFLRYLRLCWKLQDVYKLEPAGSHGVWGLDDSSFLGYIFGSGQLRDQVEIPVNAILLPNLPPTNLYFLSISRIHEVKQGPFHEHSSQLFSIANGVPNWSKVHSGLFKMYEAEVLGKRVVVQHIPVGGLLEWDAKNRQQPFLAFSSTRVNAGMASSLSRALSRGQTPSTMDLMPGMIPSIPPTRSPVSRGGWVKQTSSPLPSLSHPSLPQISASPSSSRRHADTFVARAPTARIRERDGEHTELDEK